MLGDYPDQMQQHRFHLEHTTWHATRCVFRDTCFCCSGNGAVNCIPSSQLLQLYESYTSDGVGTLACDQGQDLVYPEGAPGFVYDPTGYLLTVPGRQVLLRNGNKRLSVVSQYAADLVGQSCLTCARCLMQSSGILKRTAEAQKGQSHAMCKFPCYEHTCRSTCMIGTHRCVSRWHIHMCTHTVHTHICMHHCCIWCMSLSSTRGS